LKRNAKWVYECDALRGLENKTGYPGGLAIPSDTQKEKGNWVYRWTSHPK
jgi:hypothetical protein